MNPSITIIETKKEDGIFSSNKKFYNENLSKKEIDKIFLETRKKLCAKYNIKGSKIIHSTQKENNKYSNYKEGKDIFITNDYLKKKDLWKQKITADFLVVPEKIKNVIVGLQTADCPIIIIEDRIKKITLITHCGALQINRKLPEKAIKVLLKKYGCIEENLYVYIGTHIKKETYIYDKYPKWATNKKIWEKCIKKENNKYYIDLDTAILKQLKNQNIKNIKISEKNTFTDDEYSSHAAMVKGNESKTGQNFIGFFYK